MKKDVRQLFLNALHQIAPEIDINQLKPETVIRDEYEIDSMDFLRFVQLLHKNLNVDVPEKDYSQLRTLKSSIDYLNQKLSNIKNA